MRAVGRGSGMLDGRAGGVYGGGGGAHVIGRDGPAEVFGYPVRYDHRRNDGENSDSDSDSGRGVCRCVVGVPLRAHCRTRRGRGLLRVGRTDRPATAPAIGRDDGRRSHAVVQPAAGQQHTEGDEDGQVDGRADGDQRHGRVLVAAAAVHVRSGVAAQRVQPTQMESRPATGRVQAVGPVPGRHAHLPGSAAQRIVLGG